VVSEVFDKVERRSRDVTLLDLERLSDFRASKNSSPSAKGDLTRARAGGSFIECLGVVGLPRTLDSFDST